MERGSICDGVVNQARTPSTKKQMSSLAAQVADNKRYPTIKSKFDHIGGWILTNEWDAGEVVDAIRVALPDLTLEKTEQLANALSEAAFLTRTARGQLTKDSVLNILANVKLLFDPNRVYLSPIYGGLVQGMRTDFASVDNYILRASRPPSRTPSSASSAAAEAEALGQAALKDAAVRAYQRGAAAFGTGAGGGEEEEVQLVGVRGPATTEQLQTLLADAVAKRRGDYGGIGAAEFDQLTRQIEDLQAALVARGEVVVIEGRGGGGAAAGRGAAAAGELVNLEFEEEETASANAGRRAYDGGGASAAASDGGGAAAAAPPRQSLGDVLRLLAFWGQNSKDPELVDAAADIDDVVNSDACNVTTPEKQRLAQRAAEEALQRAAQQDERVASMSASTRELVKAALSAIAACSVYATTAATSGPIISTAVVGLVIAYYFTEERKAVVPAVTRTLSGAASGVAGLARGIGSGFRQFVSGTGELIGQGFEALNDFASASALQELGEEAAPSSAARGADGFGEDSLNEQFAALSIKSSLPGSGGGVGGMIEGALNAFGMRASRAAASQAPLERRANPMLEGFGEVASVPAVSRVPAVVASPPPSALAVPANVPVARTDSGGGGLIQGALNAFGLGSAPAAPPGRVVPEAALGRRVNPMLEGLGSEVAPPVARIPAVVAPPPPPPALAIPPNVAVARTGSGGGGLIQGALNAIGFGRAQGEAPGGAAANIEGIRRANPMLE